MGEVGSGWTSLLKKMLSMVDGRGRWSMLARFKAWGPYFVLVKRGANGKGFKNSTGREPLIPLRMKLPSCRMSFTLIRSALGSGSWFGSWERCRAVANNLPKMQVSFRRWGMFSWTRKLARASFTDAGVGGRRKAGKQNTAAEYGGAVLNVIS